MEKRWYLLIESNGIYSKEKLERVLLAQSPSSGKRRQNAAAAYAVSLPRNTVTKSTEQLFDANFSDIICLYAALCGNAAVKPQCKTQLSVLAYPGRLTNNKTTIV